MADEKEPFEDEEDREAREAEKAARERQLAEAEAALAASDLKRTLDADFSRRVLFRLIAQCEPFAAPAVHGAELERLVGRQEVGQDLMRQIGQSDPHVLGQMIAEEYSRKLKESIT